MVTFLEINIILDLGNKIRLKTVSVQTEEVSIDCFQEFGW